jgi:HAMP domain-containing protein
MKTPLIKASWGEVIDKITILRIKRNFVAGQAQHNVEHELALLEDTAAEALAGLPPIIVSDLSLTNKMLWTVEDQLRDREKRQEFGIAFTELARMVYQMNDRRAAIKKEINTLLESEIVEEKSYA